MTKLATLLVCCCLALGACNHNDVTAQPIPATPTTPTPTPTPTTNTIQYIVTGNTSAFVSVRTIDPANGVTVSSTVGLPYYVQFTTTQTSVFLFVEASTSASVPGLLQVQIIVNGTSFRSDYTNGMGPLDVAVSGTWTKPTN